MPSATRLLFFRAASVAVAGLLLFVFDRTILVAGTAALDAPGHVALWGAHTAVALALGILGALWIGVDRIAGKLRRSEDGNGPAWLSGVLFAIAGAAPIYLVSSSLVAGDWIAKQRYAKGIEIGVIAAGVIGFFVLGLLHALDGRRSKPIVTPAKGAAKDEEAAKEGDAPKEEGAAKEGDAPKKEDAPKATARWKRFVFPGIVLVGAIVFAVADAVVLPGLYAALHLFLYGGSALLLLLAASRSLDLLVSSDKARTIASSVGALLVIVAVVIVAVVAPNKRSALSVGSRAGGLILPSFSAPSRVVADELAAMDLSRDTAKTARDSKAAVDKLLGGRRDYNVLLIIVDTLRADVLPPRRGAGKSYANDADTPFMNEFLGKSYRFSRAYTQASRTRRSLPPTFRGLEANEDTERAGIALGTQASALGLTPAAVVPQYFLLPESESAQHLLIGFDRATFYEKDHQEVIVDRAREMFEGLKGQRFFSWVHFYNMHDPYFFADRLSTAADGSVAERYQKALRWLDAQMKRLHAELERAGFADNTVIFFTADHGENIGLEGGRVGHGGTVNEPEVRAPLSVYIPGQKGGVVDVPAGNVDIVPTVFDIVGAPPSPNHKGRSLLPILAGVETEAVPLYFENSSGEAQGVAIGPQKLTHVGKGNIFHRYDTDADPGEKKDLYEASNEPDRALRRAMLRKNPSLFADELKDPEVRGKLVERLRQVGPDAEAGPSLELLFQLAALSKDKAALEQGQRIFQAAKSTDVQILAVRRLFDTDPGAWTALLAARVKKAIGSPEERHLIGDLALNGQPLFAPEVLAGRVHDLVTEPPESWAPFLALVRDWKKPQSLFAEPLEALVSAFPDGPRTPESSRSLLLLMECAGSLVAPNDASAARILAIAVRPFVGDADAKVAVAAARALGKLKDADSAQGLRAKMDDASMDVRIRQAILYALTDIEGKGAAPLVVANGSNPLLTVDACQILATLKDPVALPFLRDVAAKHYNGYTRDEARKAIKAIESAQKPGAPQSTGTATGSAFRPKITIPPRK